MEREEDNFRILVLLVYHLAYRMRRVKGTGCTHAPLKPHVACWCLGSDQIGPIAGLVHVHQVHHLNNMGNGVYGALFGVCLF